MRRTVTITFIHAQVSLTVSAYHRDKSVSAKQERLLSEDLQACLYGEDPLFSYTDMLRKIETLLSELFGGAGDAHSYLKKKTLIIQYVFSTCILLLRCMYGASHV